jgi:alcohol-forming fatty acyl-CoA reductase
VRERLAGARVLLTGGSGFLGKAVLATLLEHGADLKRLTVLLRAEDTAAAERRLSEEVLENEAFSSLPQTSIREQLKAGTLRGVAGDLEANDLAERAGDGLRDVDIVIHCAASVSFEEALDDAVGVNVLGPARLSDALTAAGSSPHFIHVSTAYAGNCHQDTVREGDARHEGLASLDPAKMLAVAGEWREEAERESGQPKQARELRRTAERDLAHGRADDALARAEELRRRWVHQRLAREGRRYAIAAGWPDTYALTKAAAEALLAQHSRQTTIVRPSIIESALRTPQPGWLEGLKVADPLILAYAARGLTHLPGRADNRIDIVPVDHVANACVAAAAYPPSEPLRTIAITSTADNPLTLGELAEHVRAHFGPEPLHTRDGTAIKIGDLKFVDRRDALRHTIRRERLLSLAARAVAISPLPMSTEKALRRNSALAARVTRMVKIYGPYTELNCTFDNSNAHTLARNLTPADRAALPFSAAEFDWTEYMQQIHLPRVHRMAEGG